MEGWRSLPWTILRETGYCHFSLCLQLGGLEMGNFTRMSESDTEKEFWRNALDRGSELFLQWLFFQSDNVPIHRHIITRSKRLNGNNLHFSLNNVSVVGKSMGTTKYRLWNKRGWQSDGSIRKRESVSGNWESTAIVEFKGMQNRFLRHNDIAKFVQYLNYVLTCPPKSDPIVS